MEGKKDRNLLVTVYITNCFASPDPLEIGESCSLLPWDSVLPGHRGQDDGGRDYVLPAGYRTDKAEGKPVILDDFGALCELKLHNGCPLLVDARKRRAYLLEPVRRLQTLRQQCGMTREELAERLQVSQLELFEWESMEKRPKPQVLEKIAAVLGCKSSDIL